MARKIGRDELFAIAFVIPLAALAGYAAAHKVAVPEAPATSTAFRVDGWVTHVRGGDTIEVSGVPVRIANIDCAERGTPAGDRPSTVVRRSGGRMARA